MYEDTHNNCLCVTGYQPVGDGANAVCEEIIVPDSSTYNPLPQPRDCTLDETNVHITDCIPINGLCEEGKIITQRNDIPPENGGKECPLQYTRKPCYIECDVDCLTIEEIRMLKYQINTDAVEKLKKFK